MYVTIIAYNIHIPVIDNIVVEENTNVMTTRRKHPNQANRSRKHIIL